MQHTNPNTVSHSDATFRDGAWWDLCGGREQTNLFAKAFLSRANLPHSGSLLDFGCALGDFIPQVHADRPHLRLAGVDHSAVAISRCQERYGSIAEFFTATSSTLSRHFDIIHSSNVMEHLDNAPAAAFELMQHCHRQYIMVPFQEGWPLHSTHIAAFYRNTFDFFRDHGCDVDYRIFRVPGAWGRTLGEEIAARLQTLRRGTAFGQAHQICYAITKRSAPNEIGRLRPFKFWCRRIPGVTL